MHTRRLLLLAAGLLAVTFLMALPASAVTDNYWGYNYISSSNPSSQDAGHCSGQPAGWACVGWNYWDYTQIQRESNGGNVVDYGFKFGSNFFFRSTTTGGEYTTFWNDSVWLGYQTHYNRPTCKYGGGGSTYGQCRAIIN